MKQSEALDMITKLRLAQQAMESACKRIDELKEENKNLKEALAKQEQGEPKADNWQQYAKEGETAQDVIERTRADSDAFIKLYINKETPKSELNAMYCRGRDDGFEAGRLQGIKQERALWELARIGQEIEAEAERQEQGEPVAHIGKTQFDRLKDCGLVTTSLTSHKAFEDDIAFYTTPQQRKPLTDKQLNIIGSRWHLNLLGTDEKAELFAFARAIEAAHGIKE